MYLFVYLIFGEYFAGKFDLWIVFHGSDVNTAVRAAAEWFCVVYSIFFIYKFGGLLFAGTDLFAF